MTVVRRAVVLAAGLGRRLGVNERPKSLTPVAQEPILHRTLHALAACGVRECVLVVGHQAAQVRASVGSTFSGVTLRYVHSSRYASTNNAYSLWLARSYLDSDVFLVEGDVLFAPEILTRLSRSNQSAACAVSPWRPRFSGTVAELAPADGYRRVTRLYVADPHSGQPGPPDLSTLYKTVNVHVLREPYLREEFVPFLDELISTGGENDYYEKVLARTVENGGFAVDGLDCGDLPWQEVDDATDLDAADFLFSSTDQQLATLQGNHGGYWRYHVVDHCLLHNPYFPTPSLMAELAAQFPFALVHYPVGQSVLQRLLGTAIGQPPEHLAVANGASELINVLARVLNRVILTTPGFNEYEVALGTRTTFSFPLPPPTFDLDIHALHEAAVAARARTVIVTSPNNPTSRVVPTANLRQLAELLLPLGALLVVDESFVDFASSPASLEPYLSRYPNVAVVKSMGKAYGIGGLRLGYLAGSDTDLVATVRRELPIWNINGPAECFLRALPRYMRDFCDSLRKVRADRDALYAGLASIPSLTAVPPDANFVLIRLPEPWTAPRLVRTLFERHRIFAKDCSTKKFPDADKYVRIASRTTPENSRLVSALETLLVTEVRC